MSAPDTGEPEERLGATFWVGLVIGGAVMAYGLKGLLGAEGATRPPNLARWFIGAGIVHDALWAPIVVGAAWLTGRLVPPVARTPVRFALAVSALAIVFTYPLIRGYGVRDDNPSLFPWDYGENLVIALTTVWIVTAAVVATRVVRTRRSTR